MQLTLDAHYTIKNRVTLQVARFHVVDLFPYQGHQVVYGETFNSGIWLPSTVGRQESPARPVAFPVFADTESWVDIAILMEQLSSQDLWILSDDADYPILSIPDAYIIWPGPRFRRDAMVERCRKTIDVYSYWRDHERHLPVGFLERRGYIRTLSLDEKESIMHAWGDSLVRQL